MVVEKYWFMQLEMCPTNSFLENIVVKKKLFFRGKKYDTPCSSSLLFWICMSCVVHLWSFTIPTLAEAHADHFHTGHFAWCRVSWWHGMSFFVFFWGGGGVSYGLPYFPANLSLEAFCHYTLNIKVHSWLDCTGDKKQTQQANTQQVIQYSLLAKEK